MKTTWSILCFFALAISAAQAQIYVSSIGAETVGQYNTNTGAVINDSLVTGLANPYGIAISGSNLYVANYNDGTVAEYNATTGAVVNATLITGLDTPDAIAVSGSNLYVASYNSNSIGEYNATSGAIINASLVTGLNQPYGVAVSGSNLYVTNFATGTIGEYNATTGVAVNASLVSGLTTPYGLTVFQGNIYVANYDNGTSGAGTIGEYNASTGATVNASFLTGLSGPDNVAGNGSNIFVASYNDGTDGTIGEYTASTGATLNASLVSGLAAPSGLVVLASEIGQPTQSLTILHSFSDGSVAGDGAQPSSALIQGSDGNFYGGSYNGGTAGDGSVFQMTPSGAITILHSFGDGSLTNDGNFVRHQLTEGPDGNYYGTATFGGVGNEGVVFKVTPQGTTTILHHFGDGTVTSDGSHPDSGLTLGTDGNFYGTTDQGGTTGNGTQYSGDGTIYKITPAGTLTILHSFGDGSVTNDAMNPTTGVVLAADGNFYGTSSLGGSANDGTFYRMTPQGVVTLLHSFGDGSVTNDGITPVQIVVQGSDGNFYGTAEAGGAASEGTFYKITSSGAETILHSFGDGTVANDGTDPQQSFCVGTDGNFYGETDSGGSAGAGTLFEATPQGVVTILHSFGDGSVANDGSGPVGGLVQGNDGNFYGTTVGGGSGGDGTVFKLTANFPNLTSPVTASGNVGLPFSYQITGTNTPNSFAASGLPVGVSINPITGLISGAPTTVGTYPVAVTLTNGLGSSNFTLTITIQSLPVPVVTSILTAYGTSTSVGVEFTYQVVATNLPTSYTATGLPPGVTYDSTTGLVSGVPIESGTYYVTLTATNTTGTSNPVTLVIQILPSPPTLSQEYNILHYFGDGTVSNDGLDPNSIFQAFDGNFYGTTFGGGSSGHGTIFRMNVQGTESVFYSFFSTISSPTSLIQAADGNFYGVASSNNQILKLTPAGQLTILYSFGAAGNSNNFLGINRLTQGSDGNFYGTTYDAETLTGGTIFKITPQGTLTVLHTFGSVPNDGGEPVDGVVQGNDGNFYGTTPYGGTAGFGCAYKITPSGTYTILHSFGDGSVMHDGNFPYYAFVLGADGNFYSTTIGGGTASSGTIYKMTPLGTVTILHSFVDGSVSHDGSEPRYALLQGNDGNFYGTTLSGGFYSDGTVYQITPAGVLTIIHNFGDPTVTNDATGPNAPLIQSTAGNIYGVTNGSVNGHGTVFSIIPTLIPTHVPVFLGSTYATAGIYTPFSFTPKAAFGVSGSGVETGSSVQPQATAGGIESALVSLLPESIRKSFSTTNWTLTGTLPNYLTFDPASGTISGTPETAGTYTVTMTPNNAIGAGTPQTVTLYIDVPPGISSPVSATCTVGSIFNYQIETTPPASSYGATFLPSWLSVDTTGGVIYGMAPAAGSYVFNAVASNISGQAVEPVTLTVTGGTSGYPTITSAKTASATVGATYTYQIATSTAAAGYSALSLPTGLLFDESTGMIFGTPSETGTFIIPIYATNAAGSYASNLSLTITALSAPGIANTLLATAAEGGAFYYQVPTTGPVTSYSETGALPTGVMFNTSTGVFSGTPTVTGSFPITITVGNSIGMSTSTLTLNVSASEPFTGNPTATPYHDGIANLLKYLCDINQTFAMSVTDRAALPTLGIDTTTNPGTEYLTLTYRQNALETGITANVQTSSNLQNWTTVNPPDLDQQIGTDPNTGDPIIEVGVIANGTNKQFIRLNVTSP